MVIKIDRYSKTPIYIQISNHISQLIAERRLPPGSKLPDTRKLSNSLGVSRNTVVYAYTELESKGLIFSHVGKGTFVQKYLPESVSRKKPEKKISMGYDGLFATAWERSYTNILSNIEHLWEWQKDPGTISLASDLPDPEYFPFEEFRDCLQSAMRRFGFDLLTAGHPKGFQQLLEYLPIFLAKRNVSCESNELMIVNGVQQALSIIGKLFVDPGDTVIVENLTYPGALQIFRSLQANCVGIPLDGEGLNIDILESVLKRRKAKLLYTIPTYQNPTSTVLSLERRKQLVEICRKHQVVIVEDDYAYELNLNGKEILPLKAWDECDGTIYMGSLSNILFPGIRLSWILAPPLILDKLALIKQTSDLYTNRILQGALLEFYRKGYLEKHIKKKRLIYRKRRDTMLGAMEKYFPEEAIWQKTKGGLFQWVDIQNNPDIDSIFIKTKEHGVLFAPDSLFLVEEWKRRGIRLSFSNETEERIYKGISIIGRVLKDVITKKN